MFQALVLACLISDPTTCWEFENTRHPIKTYEQCVARAMEIATSINERLPNAKAIGWKCIKLPTGKLAT